MAIIETGSGAVGTASIDTANNLKVALPTTPANVGSVRMMSEVDSGAITGSPYLLSPEVDDDYRMRVSQDQIVDTELFNYTAQNTGKHFYANVTMTNAWSASGLTTNSANAVATTIGTVFRSYAYFPIIGSASTYWEMEGGFTAQPTTNTFIDFGGFLPGAANPYAPTDGVYFRLTSAGLQGVINNNGTETATSPFTFTYTNNTKYQFIIVSSLREVEFWINGVLYGSLPTPTGQGAPFMSASSPFAVRHAIAGGAAGAAISFILNSYTVSLGGTNITGIMSTSMNRILGSYQGFSGGTMGTIANAGTITTGNAANPTAAVPTTTTAALGSGLGGKFWETVSLAVNTDGIIMSYQVPAGTANVQGRRLVLRGLYLSSYVQTVIVGAPYTAEWFLAFGHTAVSLATAEAAGTKAPRRIILPFVQQVTAAQAAQTTVAQNVNFVDFGDAPIFVNPGEFIQLCTRHIGTAGTTGTVAHSVTPVYGWE